MFNSRVKPANSNAIDLNQAISNFYSNIQKIALCHFHRPYEELPNRERSIPYIKTKFFEGQWNDAFYLLDFIPNNFSLTGNETTTTNKINTQFCAYCNEKLEQHLSAYRFVDFNVIEITSVEEIETVEEAIIMEVSLDQSKLT